MHELANNGVEIYRFPMEDEAVADVNGKMNVSVHMCAYMQCVCVCVCFVHVCVRVFRACVCASMHACVRVFRTCVCASMHACVRVFRTCVCACVSCMRASMCV